MTAQADNLIRKLGRCRSIGFNAKFDLTFANMFACKGLGVDR